MTEQIQEQEEEFRTYGMWRSPHKRKHRAPLKPVTYKLQVSGNKTGRAGAKHRKKHFHAEQPPGYPRGVCLGPARTRGKIDKERVCYCGGCKGKRR